MADFYKDNYKEGMTVYLLYTGYDLCVGKYAPRKKYSITEGIISEMGKNYLKVSTEGQKICFRFNEETGQIWQDPKESDFVYGIEIFDRKKAAEEAALRYKLIKETSALIGSISCLLDRYSVRDLKILNSFAKMVNSERTSLGHTMEGFLDTLPSDIKDSLYRKIWAEHVYEDIRGMDMKVSKKRAKKVSGAYVNGRYDCNLSYWDNLNNLLEEIPEEQECFSLHECLTKRLQTEVLIRRCSAIDIDFINNEGIEDETQIHVYQNILTKAGTKEAEELFRSLEKELGANRNRIISCTVVASAETVEELDKLLD